MSSNSKSFLSTSVTTGVNATKRLVSIRWSLPLCVITPLVSGILLTSWLAYRSSQKAVDELVGKISKEVAANIEKQVDSYLTTPSLISAVIEAEVANGNLKVQDTRELAKSLWGLTQSENLTNNLYYGNEAGEFVYSEHHDDVSRIDFVDQDTDFRRIAYQADDVTDLSEQLKVSDYDPRVRPWYKEAAFSKVPIWSQVYIANSRDALTLTRATPIFNQAGQLQGIFGTDVYLFELSNFLKDLSVSPNGKAFIIESSGDLIAISANEKPFMEVDGEKLRLPASNSQNQLVRETVTHLLQNLDDLSQMKDQYSFNFALEGEKQLVHIYHLKDLGIDWIVGVAIPQSDYMEKIRATTRHTLIIGVGITIVASLMALAAALHIIRPINKLNQSADEIKRNRFNPRTLAHVMARPDEFSKLAKLFNDMAIVVMSRQQSLSEQVKLLKTEIDQNGNAGDNRQKLEMLLRHAKQVRKAYKDK
ncbi:sensor histidine kinase [Leptothoe spongobia]|uniref:histidine kinase n=1 Tax=Leptothoe spongobia TAU-MAC 1115 TaxID=1967444 RepID=A0A947GHX9_9CYAN|nr:cache and HAMP domain-containing protein [Leptothoe spongobia]MBT9314878.1 cache and HAMP domain-containing protein [Leptothoe spongobia TAU-MAC 1115]